MVHHVVDADRQRGVVAENHIAQRITHQHAVNAGGINARSKAGIIGSEHADRLTGLFFRLQITDGDGFALTG